MKRTNAFATVATLAAAFLAAAATASAQTFTEPLALNHAAGEDILPSPFAPGSLLLTARTTEWGRAVLAADLMISPSLVTPLDTQIGDSPYVRRLGFAATFGAFLSVGRVNGASGIAWHARRSLDGGASWTTVDPGWQLASGA